MGFFSWADVHAKVERDECYARGLLFEQLKENVLASGGMQVTLPGPVWWWLVLPDLPLLPWFTSWKSCCWTRMTLLLWMAPLLLSPGFIQLSICLATWAEQCLQLDVWKTGAIWEQMGMFLCVLSAALRDLTEPRRAQNADRGCPKNAIANAAGRVFFFIHFDFSGCFSAWSTGLNLVVHRKEGCLVSAHFCGVLSVLLLQQVGHLGFMVTLGSSFNSPPSESTPSLQSRGWASNPTLCTL